MNYITPVNLCCSLCSFGNAFKKLLCPYKAPQSLTQHMSITRPLRSCGTDLLVAPTLKSKVVKAALTFEVSAAGILH